MANFWLAFESDLFVLSCVNKVDMKNANPAQVICLLLLMFILCQVAQQLKDTFDIDPTTVLPLSAKIGLGVRELLDKIVEQVPPYFKRSLSFIID